MINRLKMYWMILIGKHHVCMGLKLSFVQRIKQAYYMFKVFGFKNLKPIEVVPTPDDFNIKGKRYTESIPSPWRDFVDAHRYILESRINFRR